MRAVSQDIHHPRLSGLTQLICLGRPLSSPSGIPARSKLPQVGQGGVVSSSWLDRSVFLVAPPARNHMYVSMDVRVLGSTSRSIIYHLGDYGQVT